MSPVRVINQKSFFRGLNTSVADTSQPKGSVARISNLLYTIRGSLRVIDGNLGFSSLNGAGPTTGRGNFMDVALYNPTGSTDKYFLALAKDLVTQLAIPTTLAAGDGGAGGTLAPSTTYYYVVTALDGAGGETPASNEASFTQGLTAHKVSLTWTAVSNATGYNIYRNTAAGTEVLLTATNLPAAVNSYTDDGTAAPGSVSIVAAPVGIIKTTGSTVNFTTVAAHNLAVGMAVKVTGAADSRFNTVNAAEFYGVSVVGSSTTFTGLARPLSSTLYNNVISMPNSTASGGGSVSTTTVSPPTANTTQTSALLKIDNSGSYTIPGSILATLPADPPAALDGTPGGGGGSGGSGSIPSGGAVVTGGTVGNISPLPTMVPFTNKIILALGNGTSPRQWNGTALSALTNGFTASFPAWAASTVYNVGDFVTPAAPNGHLYKCTQGGTSAAAGPAFPTATGATVADGKVIWQEAGPTATPAPRGAAHCIVHAGALWLWNTYPSNSADNLDGPSCLKMSDLNNPNSWNPVNTAFVGRDDGQQGMGMASYTIAETGIPPQGSLVLFKEFSTYQVLGVFGSTNFSIQRAQTDLGCIAPRSIKFVPGFGIVRLTHLGIAVFDGVRDRLISEEIRHYLFGGEDDISQMDMSFAYLSKGDLTANPPMYCLAIPVIGQGNDGRLARVLCYDLVLKAWSVVDLPAGGISVFKQIASPGTIPVTVWGGTSNGMLSRWQAGDTFGFNAWNSTSNPPVVTLGTAIPFSWRTNAAIQPNPTDRFYIRRAIFKGVVGAGTPAPTNVSANVVVNKVDTLLGITPRQIYLETLPGPPDTSFEWIIDVGQVGLDAYIDVSGVMALPLAGITEQYFQIDSIDWHVQTKPAGAVVRVT